MLVSELSVIHVSIVQMEMCGIFQMELMKQLLFSRMLEVSRIKYIFFLLNHCFLLRRRDWLRRRKQLKLRFGSVVPISGSDFVREVSQAPSDVWVVVILYKDGLLYFIFDIAECGILMQCIEEFVTRYPVTK
ncbi:hypothetical protein Ahy_B09g097598 [Arachis hypogaea]|uniref:Uncharacterized protein n=1 Tax=Arachis hypogaea TaxID=3818 RepID=A0A444XPF3_ARAHY|nr:hypothetical protein Ahy_B09g097598 [Arachis hypogaea]